MQRCAGSIVLATLVAATVATAASHAQPAPPAAYAPVVSNDPLLTARETILGQPLTYPAGQAVVTASIITVPPGGATGWHSHGAPLFAYMLEGELTVGYGTRGMRTYKPGEAFMEAVNWPHNGRNLATVPVRILAVYAGADGAVNAAPVPGPATAPPR